ncbi:hypothetical protein CGZ80_09700 [Rhodopirellula sp. MGV]|nr:hypothetical protein CGZ80_09700 [Rhodopirellula sp. MGV]
MASHRTRRRSSIGDFVFNDANFNGIQDTNETGVANVDVQLFRVVNGNATLVDSTTTDMAGFYSFAGMSLDDQYSLSFTAPNGFGFTKLNVGSDFTDSDVDDLTGSTAPFSVINGLNDRWDAGLVALGSISGVVWNDSNEDGLRQTEEPGLAGWTVYIDANDNGMLDSGEVTRTTNSSGEYEFDNLRPGTYVIAEVVEGGFSQTFPGAAGASDTGTHADGAVLQRSYSNNASTGRTFSPGEEFVGPIAPEAAELIELTSFRADSRFNAFDGSGYSVVVIDTGIDVDHPFFGADGDGDGVADRIVYQYDFADNDADATDYSGHGSHVTSVIASENPAYLGVAPDVGIIHLKVFGDDGVGYFSYVEQALQWVIANANDYKIAAVNLSVGDGLNWTQSRGLHGIDDELATLASQNIIAVAAAGNAYGLTGIEGLAYPAADPNTVSVGAVWDSNRGGPWSFGENGTDYTSDADRIASFSQRHHEMLDVLAPGALITAANAVGGVSTMRGTSMATPFVTGAAVIAQQIAFEQLGRKLSPHEFRYLLDISGAIVVDGDDENDSVFNTGAAFRRLDMLALAEAVTVYDGSQLVDTSDPSGNDSTGELGTSAGGEFRYTIELAPGENRNNVDFGNHPLDNVAPSILDVVDITPDPRKTAVDQIDVTFDEPIDLSTFDHNDITLRRNGVVVALDSTITTSLLSGNTYRIAGLAGFTTDEGIYTIDVSSSNISDLAGNAGSNTETDQWITDRSGPTSNVHALSQTQSDKTFPVFVSGSDTVAAGAGSGIVSFEIYRKLNGAPWEFWTSVPANQAMAMYNAESDDSVGFYSIAIDAAGNRESKSPILEAGTYVPDLDLPVTQVDSVDDTTPTLNVTFSGSDEGGSLLQSFEVFVSVDDAIPQSLGVVPAGQADVNGIYTGSIDYRAMTDGNVHSYRFYTIGKDGRQNVEPAPSAPADATVELQFDAPSDLEIIDFDVQRGAQQRSFIRYLDVTFNSQDFASIIATLDDADPANDRIRLNRFDNDGLGPAVPVDLQGRVSSIDQVMAIDFGSGGIGGDGNSAVGNGYYRLEIDLDGDGVIATDAETLAFYRLLGDADGNRTVDYYDVSPIVQHFGATGSTDGDLNGDEITNYDDYYRIAENLGQSVDGSLDLDD